MHRRDRICLARTAGNIKDYIVPGNIRKNNFSMNVAGCVYKRATFSASSELEACVRTRATIFPGNDVSWGGVFERSLERC